MIGASVKDKSTSWHKQKRPDAFAALGREEIAGWRF